MNIVVEIQRLGCHAMQLPVVLLVQNLLRVLSSREISQMLKGVEVCSVVSFLKRTSGW